MKRSLTKFSVSGKSRTSSKTCKSEEEPEEEGVLTEHLHFCDFLKYQAYMKSGTEYLNTY